MRTLVLPDLHGNWKMARAMLVHAGVPLYARERHAADIRTIQLGDLANCVSSSIDLDREILERSLDWFDTVLVGNHEFPYFDGPLFSGFWHDPQVEAGIRRLDINGILQPCALVGGTLLTHAGVTAYWNVGNTAADAADTITAAWAHHRDRSPLLRAIGRARHGSDPEGGILWADWEEPRKQSFNQLHGHTPLKDGPKRHGNDHTHWTLNIDVGCNEHTDRLTAIWLNTEGNIDGSETLNLTT